jgi:hypothetical protein
MICFLCHVPQIDPRLHEINKKGVKSCRHPDVIGPTAFGIFLREDLKEKAEEHFGVTWSSFKGFAEWLSARPVQGHKSNITAIFLWYCK